MDAREGAREFGVEKTLPPKAVVARARTVFRERFGVEAEFGGVAPGRVNLIGEHTDYNGGFVLPIAIDRVCVAAAAPGSRAGRWRVHSADLGQDAELNVAGALEPSGFVKGLWVSYLAGVASLFREATGEALPGLDVVVTSSVLMGGGLASSAALTVALATLLEAATGAVLEPLDKARLCQSVEHEYAGVPCGIMDPLASVMGREGHALLIDCREETVSLVRMPSGQEAVVLVVDSGVRHALADGEYTKRRATCESAARKLGVHQLRDAKAADLRRGRDPERGGDLLTDEEFRCARHVVSEDARVIEAAAALEARDLATVGRAMVLSHESLRDDYRVSCAELDDIVAKAMEVEEVFGARMTGAGFGGCAIVLTAPDAVGRACAAISTSGRNVSVVRASDGAGLI